MSQETLITVVGNLAGDPELGYTPNGNAYARFTIASTPRRYDRHTGEWVDGETLWLRCTCWRDLAENVAETLAKGTRVIATGGCARPAGRPRPATSAPRSGSRSTRSGHRCDSPRLGSIALFVRTSHPRRTHRKPRQPAPNALLPGRQHPG